jgi:hypothetical protein
MKPNVMKKISELMDSLDGEDGASIDAKIAWAMAKMMELANKPDMDKSEASRKALKIYNAAKDELEKVEGRINRLDHFIDTHTVVDPSTGAWCTKDCVGNEEMMSIYKEQMISMMAYAGSLHKELELLEDKWLDYENKEKVRQERTFDKTPKGFGVFSISRGGDE